MERIINAYIDSLRAVLSSSYVAKCEIVLTAKDLKLDFPNLQDCLEKISLEYSSFRINDEKVYLLLIGQIVFFKYGIALDHRKRFLKYWIEEENFKKSGLDIITITWMIEVASENIMLLNAKWKNYIIKWQLKNANKVNSFVSKSWFPYYLEKYSEFDLAKKIYQEIVDEKFSNGSWSGDLSRTVRILYALSYSRYFDRLDFDDSANFIVNRIRKGIEMSVKLNSQILKLYKKLGLVTEYDNNYIVDCLKKNDLVVVERIRKLIESDQIIDAIDLNRNLLRNNFCNEFILLKSSYIEIESLYMKGSLKTDLFLLEKRKIKNSVLSLIDRLNNAT